MKIKFLSRKKRRDLEAKLATLDESSAEAKEIRGQLGWGEPAPPPAPEPPPAPKVEAPKPKPKKVEAPKPKPKKVEAPKPKPKPAPKCGSCGKAGHSRWDCPQL